MGTQSTGIFPGYVQLRPLVILTYTGMILADAGFDVFMLNVRGTTYSQQHVNLTKNDKAFWKYTLVLLILNVNTGFGCVRKEFRIVQS